MHDTRMIVIGNLRVVSASGRATSRIRSRARQKHKWSQTNRWRAGTNDAKDVHNVYLPNTRVSLNTLKTPDALHVASCIHKLIQSTIIVAIALSVTLQAFQCQEVTSRRQVNYEITDSLNNGQFQDILLATESKQTTKTIIDRNQQQQQRRRQDDVDSQRGLASAPLASFGKPATSQHSSNNRKQTIIIHGKRSRDRTGRDAFDDSAGVSLQVPHILDNQSSNAKTKYPHLARSTRPQSFNSMLSSLSTTANDAERFIVEPRSEPMARSRDSRQQQSRSRKQRSNGNAPTSTSTIQAQDKNKKCALILQRTYVRKLGATTNDIDGLNVDSLSVEPTGRIEKVCLTYDEVNKSIEEAKRRQDFKLTKELMEAVESIEPLPKYIAQLGELNQEVTKILTSKYDLSPDEILNGLPLIDMSRTNFWPICPLMVKPIQCDPTGRFRSFTGHCNNLDNPIWGAAQTPFVRYLAPKHPDGIEQDRVSALDETQLTPPRVITSQVHHDADRPSSDLSLLIMVWGQFVDHDVAQAAPPRNEEGLDFNCCRESHPNCKPIEIPENDPLYSRFGQRCMDFKRSLAGLRPNCALGPRVHINTITATIDGNTIYGSTKGVADQLRAFSGGLMQVQNVFDSMNLKPLLPKQLVRPDLDCFERPNNVYCFLAGDDRVNEQPTLTVMHTIWVRDHNRLASQLEKLNPHWDDDRIYHETRHIIAAKIQNILVSEYLPMLIGKDMMMEYNLTRTPKGSYWQGYSPTTTPSISQGFTTAAFRQGHTFIQGKVRLHDSKSHNFIDSILLRRLFKRPFHYYQPGRMDQVLAGIVNTPAQTYDPFITEEIGGHLFQEPGEAFGMDLPAINLARGREQGVPGYNLYREWCGLPRAKTFEQLMPYLANQTAFKYSNLYKHVDDIDLWSGGVSEYPIRGGLVGPTFACIIARQFSNIKRGDRFWYENAGFPSQFTPKQLDEVKKATLARVICKNSDNMRTIQRQALRLAHPILNPRVMCRDIPDLDLKYWREDPNKLGSFFN